MVELMSDIKEQRRQVEEMEKTGRGQGPDEWSATRPPDGGRCVKATGGGQYRWRVEKELD